MDKGFVTVIVPNVPMDKAIRLRQLIAKKFGLNSRLKEYRLQRWRSKNRHGKPRDDKLIKQIVRLRNKGLTWREIGPKLGMTHQGPYLLYRRWVQEKHWREH
jgi:hypothetical protein